MQNDFHIFIVEDDADISEILEDNLKREGYKTLSFKNGKEGIDALLNPFRNWYCLI